MNEQFNCRNKSNIILVGFMGSGKTSVAKIIAKALKMKFIDSDREIENIANSKITKIFAQGEQVFRNLETTFLKNNLQLKNTVLATGGGIIQKSENIRLLQQIGILYFLQTPFKQLWQVLEKSKNRPIVNQKKSIAEKYNYLNQLYETRLTNYKQADFIIYIDREKTTTTQTANKIITIIKQLNNFCNYQKQTETEEIIE